MMNLGGHMFKTWEDTGLLESTPNERKEFVADILTTAYNILHEKNINDDWDFSTWVFPVMARISKYTDVSKDEIPEIINELMKKRKEFLITIPFHLEDKEEPLWTCRFADEKILNIEYKNRLVRNDAIPDDEIYDIGDRGPEINY